MADSHGSFAWYELMTTDMEAAKAFYAAVVGWDAQDVSMPGATYILFTAGGALICGLTQLSEDARKMGLRPSWVGYVAADPQMATIALLKWLDGGQARPAEFDAPGRVSWHELVAADWEAAFAFYRELFGWQKAQADTGLAGTYQLFSAAGQTIGGMFTKSVVEPAPFWLYYFNVGDIDAAIRRVTAGGGTLLNGPIEVPGKRWIARFADPQGAVFALAGKRAHDGIGYFERVERKR